MTPEERAKQVCSYRNLRMIETLRAEVADAIRQAIQEEREAIIDVIHNWGEPYLYQPYIVKAIRERK